MHNRIRFFAGALIVLVIVLGTLAGPLQAQDESAQQQNADAVLQFFEHINERDFAMENFEQFYALDHVFHWQDAEHGWQSGSMSSHRNAWYSQSLSFSDYTYTLDQVAASDDTVMVHFDFRGLFDSNWNPPMHHGMDEVDTCKATNEEEAWDGVYIFRFEDGLVAESWLYWDNPINWDPAANCGQ